MALNKFVWNGNITPPNDIGNWNLKTPGKNLKQLFVCELTWSLRRSSCLSASILACVIVGAADDPRLNVAVVSGKSWNCSFWMAWTRSCSSCGFLPPAWWCCCWVPVVDTWSLFLPADGGWLTGVVPLSLPELELSEFGAVNVPEFDPGLGLWWCGWCRSGPVNCVGWKEIHHQLIWQCQLLSQYENGIFLPSLRYWSFQIRQDSICTTSTPTNETKNIDKYQ